MNKICEICGSDISIQHNKKTDMDLCKRHSKQIYKYGKITDARQSRESEKYFINNKTTIIKIYDRMGNYINEFVIDTTDIEKINRYKWSLTKGHIATKDKNNKTIYLHRYLLDVTDKNVIVDHIDGNPLNNKRNNLRIGTQELNARNHGICSTNTSGVTGVTWDKQRSKWAAQIVYKNKNHHLGRFNDFDDAVKARKDAEIKFYGDWRRNK